LGAGILELPWDGIVLDESTAIRNPGAQTTKTLLVKTGHIIHRAILTGLPNPQGEMDFFAQMAFLHGSFMGAYNYWAWRQRYFHEPSGTYDWTWNPKPGTVEAIKKEVHKTAFFLTRKEAGVGEHRVVERRYVDMNPKQRKLYMQVERDFAYDTMETVWATVKTIWMARLAGGFSPDRERRQCLNDGKVKVIINLLKTELKEESVVIWFRFNEELFAVAKKLGLAKIPFTSITGGRTRAENQARKKKFQDGKVRVILMQMKMGKYGWDLSRADTEIRYSEDYDYETFAQSRDRIVSVHKKTTLLSISLITRGTIDEDVVDTLNDKAITAHNFNSKLRERLRASWDMRHPGSDVPRKRAPWARRVMPGDAQGKISLGGSN
jgi:SNF2 family DNA or RNA helicase